MHAERSAVKACHAHQIADPTVSATPWNCVPAEICRCWSCCCRCWSTITGHPKDGTTISAMRRTRRRKAAQTTVDGHPCMRQRCCRTLLLAVAEFGLIPAAQGRPSFISEGSVDCHGASTSMCSDPRCARFNHVCPMALGGWCGGGVGADWPPGTPDALRAGLTPDRNASSLVLELSIIFMDLQDGEQAGLQRGPSLAQLRHDAAYTG